MKKIILPLITIFAFALACNTSKNLANIQPKEGYIEIPAQGELRIWNNIQHSSFEVLLTNDNENQSCELYYVKSSGKEKWINPSLLAKSSKLISIPKDGHLFIKNFNPNTLKISYKIKE